MLHFQTLHPKTFYMMSKLIATFDTGKGRLQNTQSIGQRFLVANAESWVLESERLARGQAANHHLKVEQRESNFQLICKCGETQRNDDGG